jgi:putative membrane protein
MMGFGGAGYGGAWLWMLAGVLFVVAIVLLVVWAIGAAVGRPDEDEAIALLRARFARGEIDAAAFEQARQTLGATRPSDARSQRPAIVGLALVGLALLAGLLAGALAPAVAARSPGGMMGPGLMGGAHGGYGDAPTAPAGTSVRMTGSRFEPTTTTTTPRQTVRWSNDDAAPHTVKAERVDRRTIRMDT